jgi:hypothetical protein
MRSKNESRCCLLIRCPHRIEEFAVLFTFESVAGAKQMRAVADDLVWRTHIGHDRLVVPPLTRLGCVGWGQMRVLLWRMAVPTRATRSPIGRCTTQYGAVHGRPRQSEDTQTQFVVQRLRPVPFNKLAVIVVRVLDAHTPQNARAAAEPGRPQNCLHCAAPPQKSPQRIASGLSLPIERKGVEEADGLSADD